MSGTSVISTTWRRELSSSFFFLQGKAPKEIHAILTETLACFLPGRAKDLSAPLYLKPGTYEMPRNLNTAIVACFMAIALTDNPNSLPLERHSFPGYVAIYVRTTFVRYERRQKMIYSETFVCMCECSNELT